MKFSPPALIAPAIVTVPPAAPPKKATSLVALFHGESVVPFHQKLLVVSQAPAPPSAEPDEPAGSQSTLAALAGNAKPAASAQASAKRRDRQDAFLKRRSE
ncbi:MAG: hypothetical protein QM811_23895 [Pirellulales bacterium]